MAARYVILYEFHQCKRLECLVPIIYKIVLKTFSSKPVLLVIGFLVEHGIAWECITQLNLNHYRPRCDK